MVGVFFALKFGASAKYCERIRRSFLSIGSMFSDRYSTLSTLMACHVRNRFSNQRNVLFTCAHFLYSLARIESQSSNERTL